METNAKSVCCLTRQVSGSLGSHSSEGDRLRRGSGSLINWDSFASLEYSLDTPPDGITPWQAGHDTRQTTGSLPEADAFANLEMTLGMGGVPRRQGSGRGSLPEGDAFANLEMTLGMGGAPPRQGSGGLPMGALVEGEEER